MFTVLIFSFESLFGLLESKFSSREGGGWDWIFLSGLGNIFIDCPGLKSIKVNTSSMNFDNKLYWY